jgi:hypothetical protein
MKCECGKYTRSTKSYKFWPMQKRHNVFKEEISTSHAGEVKTFKKARKEHLRN